MLKKKKKGISLGAAASREVEQEDEELEEIQER